MNPELLLHGLLASHGAAFSRIARVYAGSTGESDDLHQEILLQLWRAIPGFRGDADRGTWAYRVALNTALTWRRQSVRRDVPIPADGPVADTGQAEEALLEEFCASLRSGDRAVLLLYLDGLDHAAIGVVLGLTPNAVSIRLHRIRAQYIERYLED